MELEIPAFTRSKNQFLQREIEQSKQLSMICIHVEKNYRTFEEQVHCIKWTCTSKLTQAQRG